MDHGACIFKFSLYIKDTGRSKKPYVPLQQFVRSATCMLSVVIRRRSGYMTLMLGI